ncbi:methionyl-tRNA formyltransferase [Pseudoalteromonas obscura]|uniref:Formyltransferase family protein n=1 Tax=Pseudoalteromonas obscura TaxID=3048491 RepID=A0ABT7ER99_9GAMM|nr:formyltransferase family protein [Pseudoalteromonas sp. P94(2023)]MDK2597580.1 formyltransferase family protein [Pseudoalteromonas sp. P94(2023)]
MKAGFIGCVDSSRVALETLIGIDGLDVSAVVTRECSAVNTDFCDLTDICIGNNIPVHFEDPKEREASVDFLAAYDLDIVFCIGWSYLLSERMLSLPKQGVIGFHPAKLPSNRGRHPIIWALALGLDETASTFFKMDAGADSGPIVSQVPVTIEATDNATSLYKKILDVTQIQLSKLGTDLVNGVAQFVEQDHDKATYWRKRSRVDGLIDFRMSAVSIHNLVRALASPYPGAEFVYEGQHFTVQSSALSEEKYPTNIEPGKVLGKTETSLLVKTAGDEAIFICGLTLNNIAVGDFL